MLKGPSCARRKVRWRSRLIQLTIDIKPYNIGFPLNSEIMEGVGKLLASWKPVSCGEAAGTRITGSMKRAVYNLRIFANVLHHIDFSAGGPTLCVNVCAQPPKRWPLNSSLQIRLHSVGFSTSAAVGLKREEAHIAKVDKRITGPIALAQSSGDRHAK